VWRPSRWLLAALLAMTPLAILSVLASEMPRVAAWPLALATLVYGGWLAYRERSRPLRELVFPGNGAPVLVDGVPITEVVLQWRGPLAFLRWRDGKGCRHRLLWWPDTLPAAARRELRLAAPDREAARGRPSMAP
jgi:toxin CptA